MREHHVGRLRLHPDLVDLRETVREMLCVRVVFGEPLDVVFERIEARRREHAGLAHAAAQHLARAARAFDERLAAHEHRSDRRPQSFRKADRDRIERCAERRHRFARRDRRIADARAVQMRR